VAEAGTITKAPDAIKCASRTTWMFAINRPFITKAFSVADAYICTKEDWAKQGNKICTFQFCMPRVKHSQEIMLWLQYAAASLAF
jgi:hypothetical protein